MLGKLLKYEVKATARFFLPLYGALLAMTLINKLFFWMGGDVLMSEAGSSQSVMSEVFRRMADIPAMLSMVAYIVIIVAVFIATMIVTVQRFYTNLMGDQGYLMFTLPVTAADNILSKLLVAILWTIASSIVTVLSIFLLMVSPEFLREIPQAVMELLRGINTVFELNAGVFLVLTAALLLVSVVSSILQVYVSMAIGQLFNRHRLLASVGVYIGINFAFQTIGGIFGVIWGAFANNNVYVNQAVGPVVLAWWIFALVVSVLTAAAFYIVTQMVLTKRLNLE